MNIRVQKEGLKSRLRLAAVAVCLMMAAVTGLWSCHPTGLPNLTGTYMSNDGGIYYVEQTGDTLWWAGISLDRELPTEDQWHRGLNFTNVFRGTIKRHTITGEWSDVPRGAILNHGTLELKVTTPGSVINFTRVTATGNFGGSEWHRVPALDDTRFNNTATDIISRFDAVKKNDGNSIHDDNLKPYRDQTVVYGRLTTAHLDYMNDNDLEKEIPHVNYGPQFSPTAIPAFRNFGKREREFDSFDCYFTDDGDADFDLRLKVDLDKLEPDFYTTGWGDRDQGPQVFSLKLNDAATRTKLDLAANEGYLGLESIMYGRPGTCDDNQVSPVNGGLSVLPGWADLFSNSVLINGRPINGLFSRENPTSTCDFVQPCPFVTGVTPENYLSVPAGIQLGSLLLSAIGNGQIDAKGNAGAGPGTYLRVTGTLVLDCGHATDWGLDHPCFDDDPSGDPGDISGHSNQEIHPIYSIDVINYPYRPEDIKVPGNSDLSGTYGGTDGSTYYVRQLGNEVWWLGQMRDRQPMQRGTHSPLIGSNQLKAAFDAGDPPCTTGQCWAFATVFKGIVTVSPIQTVIEGDWAGVPQSTSAGSFGGHMKFFVFNRKMIIPATPNIFPVRVEKMYDAPPVESKPVIGRRPPTAPPHDQRESGSSVGEASACSWAAAAGDAVHRAFAKLHSDSTQTRTTHFPKPGGG